MSLPPESIRIVSFESKHQKDAVALFVAGLSSSYKGSVSDSINIAQGKFIADKTNPTGDMYDIEKSFMLSRNSHFWVAITPEDKVVGIVGVTASTYPAENKFVYCNDNLNPENVCELLRMSVHENARGMGLGKRLCETVEQFGKSHGMKRIVLSTLAAMHLALGLYSKSGYTLLNEESTSYDEIDIVISHLAKDIT